MEMMITVLEDVINPVLVCTKKGLPTAADVMKTAATKLGMMVVSYMTAYRALGYETRSMRNAVMKSFKNGPSIS